MKAHRRALVDEQPDRDTLLGEVLAHDQLVLVADRREPGRRVPVVRILSGLAGGMSIAEMTHEYGITEDDVQAALLYASELVEQEEHHPLPTE